MSDYIDVALAKANSGVGKMKFTSDLRGVANESWMTIGGKPFALEAVNRIDQLHAALLTARDTIKALHGPIAWDIYDQNAPEMKQINAALEKAKT